MPVNWQQVEREEDSIQRDYEEGLISSAEAARAMRELQDDVRASEQEAREHHMREYDERNGW